MQEAAVFVLVDHVVVGEEERVDVHGAARLQLRELEDRSASHERSRPRR